MTNLKNSGVAREIVLRLLLFLIFINDLHNFYKNCLKSLTILALKKSALINKLTIVGQKSMLYI